MESYPSKLRMSGEDRSAKKKQISFRRVSDLKYSQNCVLLINVLRIELRI